MVLSGFGCGGESSVRYPWVYKARVFALELDLWIYSVYRKEKERLEHKGSQETCVETHAKTN